MQPTEKTTAEKPAAATRKLRIFGCLLVAFVVATLTYFIAARFRFVDYQVYYYAGLSLLAGRTDLYSSTFSLGELLDYRYPPLFLLLIWPLSLLSFSAATYVWWLLCWAQEFGCIYYVRRLVRENGRAGMSLFCWVIVSLAVAPYYVMALQYGNAQIFVTMAIFGSFCLALRSKVIQAALLMALAITFKVFVLLAIPYFILKKQWNYLAAVGLFVVILNLLPAFYFGFGKNLELVGTWFDHIVLDHERHETIGPINLSLKGQLRRHLTDIDYSERVSGTDWADTEYRQVNLVSIPSQYAAYIWIGLSLILYLVFAVVVWRNRAAPASGQRRLLEYGLIVCLTLLVNPLSYKIYFILLLLPLAALANFAFTAGSTQAKVSRYVVYFVAAANVILPLIPGRIAQRLLLVIGTDFWITTVVTATLFYVLASATLTDDLDVEASSDLDAGYSTA